jgi:anti-sigma factor RsiW
MSFLDTILNRAPVPSCQEMVELVTGYLEGTLPARDAKRFERHIGACENCSRYLEQMRAAIAVTGRARPETLSAAAMDELIAAFRSWNDPEEKPPCPT